VLARRVGHALDVRHCSVVLADSGEAKGTVVASLDDASIADLQVEIGVLSGARGGPAHESRGARAGRDAERDVRGSPGNLEARSENTTRTVSSRYPVRAGPEALGRVFPADRAGRARPERRRLGLCRSRDPGRRGRDPARSGARVRRARTIADWRSLPPRTRSHG